LAEGDPQPHPGAARLLARGLGPALLLVYLAALAAASLLPARDKAAMLAEREAGRAALPSPPPPALRGGIDNRSLDPEEPRPPPAPTVLPPIENIQQHRRQGAEHPPQPAHDGGQPPSGRGHRPPPSPGEEREP